MALRSSGFRLGGFAKNSKTLVLIPNLSEARLATQIQDNHYGILEIRFRMRQAPVRFGYGILPRCSLIKPPRGNSIPGTPIAIQVLLVEPVAYPRELSCL